MKPFAELSRGARGIELLRWILVLPAAVAPRLAIGGIVSILIRPLLAAPVGSPPASSSAYRDFVVRACYMLTSAAFVLAGAKMAPRFRVATAIGLAFGLSVYSFLSHVLVHLGRGTPHYIHFGLEAAACAATTMWLVKKSGTLAKHEG
jgi:hypothetical protein